MAGAITGADIRFEDYEMEARTEAHKAASSLIQQMATYHHLSNVIEDHGTDFMPWADHRLLQVATAESLTAGMIMSTLVDVPIGGAYKYGSMCVYATDAKRVLLGVQVDDVYCHRCAKEMALGVLKNSNACLAIAVTGNAMPDQTKFPEDVCRAGEVFICIAGYVYDPTIESKVRIVTTNTVENFVSPGHHGNTMVKRWIEIIREERMLKEYLERDPAKAHLKADLPRITDGFNEFIMTSHLSSYIRNKTVAAACNAARSFIVNRSPIHPTWLKSGATDTIQFLTGDSTNKVSCYAREIEHLLTVPVQSTVEVPMARDEGVNGESRYELAVDPLARLGIN